jgi:hypothetical protein
MRQEIPCPNSAYIRETERDGAGVAPIHDIVSTLVQLILGRMTNIDYIQILK